MGEIISFCSGGRGSGSGMYWGGMNKTVVGRRFCNDGKGSSGGGEKEINVSGE